jgi:hypothetical protein
MRYIEIPSDAYWKPRWRADQAVAYALGEVHHPDKSYAQLCDHFCAWSYGFAGSGYYSAIKHWYAIPSNHKRTSGKPPVGALVFWSIGTYGHVAIVVKEGYVASNDIKRYGKIDVVPIPYINQRWGARYLGWTVPYLASSWGTNPNKPPVVIPEIDLGKIREAAQKKDKSYKSGTTKVQKALRAEKMLRHPFIEGRFGPKTRAAYQKWQKKLGYEGGAANGIPGKESLTKLGRRHGFGVK